MIKVVACTSSSDELTRLEAAPVFVDVCSAVTELIAAVETQRQERVTKLTVLEVRAPESTSFQATVLVNIGSKIMHFALPQVHAPAALASVQLQVNAFGIFFSVFTSVSCMRCCALCTPRAALTRIASALLVAILRQHGKALAGRHCEGRGNTARPRPRPALPASAGAHRGSCLPRAGMPICARGAGVREPF